MDAPLHSQSMPDEQVFQRITGDPTVNATIAESAHETP